jgi:hypothetical protein
MAGNFNSSTNISFTAVDFQIVAPTITSESFSGKMRRIGQGHQYYTFSVKLPPLTSYQFGPIAAFISKQFGMVDSFTIQLPELSYNTGTNKDYIGGAQNTAALAAGVKTCTISGMTPDKMQVLRAGDFFKFNNHSKVYMAVDDLNSNSSGQGTLNFSGGLVAAVPINTNITVDSVPFTVIMDSDIQEYRVGLGGMTEYEFKCREVW